MSSEPIDSAVTLAGVERTAPGGLGASKPLSVPMDPDDGLLFCPRRGVNAGASQRLDRETDALLHGRLKALSLMGGIASLTATVRFLFVQQPGAVATGLLAAVAAATWLYLHLNPRASGAALTTCLATMFGAMLLSVSYNSYTLLGMSLTAGEFGTYFAQVNRMPGLYLLIMLAYAMMIPSSWRRTLGFVLLVVAVATIPGLLLMRTHADAFAAARTSIDNVEQLSFSLMVLFIGAVFAVFGSHVIQGYRRAAADIDDAGMYRLLGKLGEGGMGEVWRAEHRMLARPAAIKIIRPDLLGGDAHARTATERFTREARATASLQSPHTVQLYDFGTTRDGTFFYVMEMLQGMDLEDLVRRHGALSPRRAVYLLAQAARSLQEAHDRGLIHRDIKPGNLFVGVFAGAADWVKVLDFGLVKSQAQDEANTALTVEGVTTGTPAYFPPEMAAGAGAADTRSDIYALAAVAYWLVTGQLVFTGNTALEMVLQHVQKEPEAPSARIETPLPAALEQAILAGLSKDPALRPQSMREFAQRLEQALEDDWTPREAREWWHLHEPELFTGTT